MLEQDCRHERQVRTREERLQALKNSCIILWSGRRLRRIKPQVRARGKRMVAEIVVENRD